MTFVEKYPFSWQSHVQDEVKNLVDRVHALSNLAPLDELVMKVEIDPIVWNSLNTYQHDYFTSLLGGIYYITKLKQTKGYWLCVHRENLHLFHYHAPLRVRPIRVYK